MNNNNNEQFNIIKPSLQAPNEVSSSLDNPNNKDKYSFDKLSSPGIISKAKLHGNARRFLNIPKNFNRLYSSATKIEFCDDCYLPQETPGYVEKYKIGTDPKMFALCGYGIYFYFVFMKYIILNFIILILLSSIPFMVLSQLYFKDLYEYCSTYYKSTIDSNESNPLYTTSPLCLRYLKVKKFSYTSFDWMTQFSSDSLRSYSTIITNRKHKTLLDDIILNYNLISFMTQMVLLITNFLFINLSSSLLNEVDMNDESPSDYNLMISCIPKNVCELNQIATELLTIDIKVIDINLSFKYSKFSQTKKCLNDYKRKEMIYDKTKKIPTNALGCIRKKETIEEVKSKLNELNKDVNEHLSKMKEFPKDDFTGVAFVTFNTEDDTEKYLKMFPNTIIGKVIILIKYYVCCCLNNKRDSKRKYLIKTITVEKAPEPEDIIWENLEFSYHSRVSRTVLGYVFSIICIGISFGIVLGLNYLQDSDENMNDLLRYGVSALITICISIINFIVAIIFHKITMNERPWSYTEYYLGLSNKLTIFTFINSAIVPFASNLIKFGSQSNDVLVNNIFFVFLSNAFLSPFLSLSCYDLLLLKLQRYFIEKKYPYIKEPIIEYTQAELNEIYENPDIDISTKYSNLGKTFLMTVFYIPIFPLGVIISLIGVIITYFIEKFRLVHVYKKSNMVNQSICFFYFDYFTIGLFVYAIGNYIFIHDTAESNTFELISIILFGILSIIPYNILLRKVDFSGAFSSMNITTYDNAYFTFPFDYERLNPMTQRKGIAKYIKKLLEKNLINEEQYKIIINQLDHINIIELFQRLKNSNNIGLAGINDQLRSNDNQDGILGNNNHNQDNGGYNSLNNNNKNLLYCNISNLLNQINIMNNAEGYTNNNFCNMPILMQDCLHYQSNGNKPNETNLNNNHLHMNNPIEGHAQMGYQSDIPIINPNNNNYFQILNGNALRNVDHNTNNATNNNLFLYSNQGN